MPSNTDFITRYRAHFSGLHAMSLCAYAALVVMAGDRSAAWKVAGVAKALGITAMGARKAMARLEAAGFVEGGKVTAKGIEAAGADRLALF